jgi:hypothetical protein
MEKLDCLIGYCNEDRRKAQVKEEKIRREFRKLKERPVVKPLNSRLIAYRYQRTMERLQLQNF